MIFWVNGFKIPWWNCRAWKAGSKKGSEEIIKEKIKFVIPICEESIIEYKLTLDSLKTL